MKRVYRNPVRSHGKYFLAVDLKAELAVAFLVRDVCPIEFYGPYAEIHRIGIAQLVFII